MKLKPATALVLAFTSSAGAYAASDFVDTAQVVSSKPIIERVAEQRQECEQVPAPQRSSNNILGPIIGGVLGGLLGHQIGQGSGQTAATIVGAAGGAAAGSVVGNRRSASTEQQCRMVESSREVVNGYDVVYRYNGRDVNVALPYDPGSTIKVGVGVVVDERAADAGREPPRERQTYRDAQPIAASAPAGDNPGYRYRY